MRPSRVRVTAGWLGFSALIVGMDLAAVNAVVKARSFMSAGVGGGPSTRHTSYHEKYDGSAIQIVRNSPAGTTTVTVMRPATTAGLCRVWWPAVVAALLTLLAVALARTDAGRRFIAESPLPHMTTRRWMIVTAVLGIEGGLVISRLKDTGVDPRHAQWTPILIGLAILHALAFAPAGLALLHHRLRRDRPDARPAAVGTQR